MNIKNLKFYLTTIFALFVAITVTNCSNEQARREYEKEQERPKIEIPSGNEDFYTTPIEDSEEINEIIEETGKHR